MTQPILVTGASGRTGSAIAAALVARGIPVRGMVRRDAQALKVEGMGVRPVHGDLNDPASLVAAAQGCATLIHVGPPMDPREVEQTDAMLAAARAADARHFIYYSVMQPLRREVEHHKLKLIAEEHVVESGLPYTILQPSRYMQHLEPILAQVREGVHEMPFSIDATFNVVDLMDLAEATAVVAATKDYLYATYELAGPEALSQRAMAETLSTALGRTVEARKVDIEEMARRAAAKGVPAERIERMAKMNRHYDHHGFRGNANALRWLLGREPTTFAAYVDRLLAA
ncbi:SDR family oxidoreductase [Novosphingobium sp. BL-52-GroH]|uniref:SDR family oxidoreductase n=1 Tax=Novosphingobium sp. BL-52-GroH TaxID=3349877 RepID=UPI00384F1DE7